MVPALKIIYKHKIFSKIACALLRVKNHSYVVYMAAREHLDLFDYKRIAQPLPKYFSEIITDNNCFGIGYCIRNYAKWQKQYLDVFIEHGYFWGQFISKQEELTYAKCIFTFSEIRKSHIEKRINNKTIIPIGPYIHYAPHYCDPIMLDSLKQRLGKTLLVFFAHSGTGCNIQFDIDYLICKIESIRSKFNSVIISLFWSDINSEIEKLLLPKGYIIVSSGNRWDYLFLSRQKSIISLSDVTMSNCVGTHIGYCTYMGKPHWLIRQNIEFFSLTEKGKVNIETSKDIEKDLSSQIEQNELSACLSNYSDVLTEYQKDCCSKYFGFDCVQTPDEMRKLLLEYS